MGRKKNKHSKYKGNKSSNKSSSTGAKQKDESQASTSQSHGRSNESKVLPEVLVADDTSTHSTEPSTSQLESTSQSLSNEPVAAKRLSKREQFERSRSGSSLNSENSDKGRSIDQADKDLTREQTGLFNAACASTDQPNEAAQDRSAASAELTQEALSIHTQLLETSPAHSLTHATGLPPQLSLVRVPLDEREPGKRGSMLSHDDCESGVGTYSAQSEGTHRDDTFADDQDIHPVINADLDIQASEMHHMAQDMLYMRPGSSPVCGPGNTANSHNDPDKIPVKQTANHSSENHDKEENIAFESGVAIDNTTEEMKNDDIIVTGLSSATYSTEQLEVKVEGKPPKGSLQRQVSSSGSVELSRTNQMSHSQSHSNSVGTELGLSGTIPQGLASSASSRTDPFSIMSASKTSTGMAYHSTCHTLDSDFALTGTGTSHSLEAGDENDLEASGDVIVSSLSRNDGSGGERLLLSDDHDQADIHSSTSAISTVGDLPDILSPSGAGNVRASLDDAEEADRRLSLDYDLGSSIESMGIIRPIKFTNIGVSLFDELQMVGDGAGDSSVKSTPRKSRSNTVSSVLSDKGHNDSLGDTLASVSEKEEAHCEQLEHPSGTKSPDPSSDKSTQQSTRNVKSLKADDKTKSSSSSLSEQEAKLKSAASSIKEGDEISNPESITDDETSRSAASKTLSHSSYSCDHGGEMGQENGAAAAGYNAYPEHVQSAPSLLERQRLEEEAEQRRLYAELYNQHQQQLNEMCTKTQDSMSNIRVTEIGNMSESESKGASTPREDSDGAKEVSFSAISEAVEEYRSQQYKNRAQNPPVHPEQLSDVDVDERGDILNAETYDADTSLNHSLVVEQSVEEILENRELVASAVAALNQEITNLEMENKDLYEKMTLYRNSSKQYKQKADSFESYLKAQRAQVKELEIKLAQINSERQNVRNVAAMTEQVLLLNTCVQVEPKTYESHTQASVSTVNRACQSEAADLHGCAFHKQTSTHDLESSGEGGQKGDTMLAVEQTAEKKKNLAKASAMLDKILRQMNNIAGEVEEAEDSSILEALGDDREPETTEKWRHLAMTAISTDPQVLRVQRSLAKAAMEYDILNTKISKSIRDADAKFNELNTQLQTANGNLQKSRDDCHVWQCKYEGDRTEVEMLRDRTQAMEKELLLKQMENDRLSDEVKVRTEVMESGDLVSREAMDKVRQERNDSENKATKLEIDNRKLHEELCKVQESRTAELEKLGTLESSVSALHADKAALEVELASLREEYQHLQKGLSSVEKLFQFKSNEGPDDTPGSFQGTAEQQIEELKKHVFESKKVTKGDTEEKAADVLASSTHSAKSTHSSDSAANSVHNEILKQSELILGILRENGDIEDEEALRQVELVNWQDVKKSITEHLRGETADKVSAAVSEASGDQQSTPEETKPDENSSPGENNSDSKEDLDSEGTPLTQDDLEVRSQLSELATALSNDLGIRVNLVVESPKQSFDPPVSESTPRVLDKKAKQKMELEQMNRDYEELRKKRLALLLQAYTGKSDYKSTISQTQTVNYTSTDDAKTDYDQQTAALRQRIQAFREEIKQDRSSTYPSMQESPRDGTAARSHTSESNGTYQSTLLRQSKNELDSLLSKGSRVPRVCVGSSGKNPRSTKNTSGIRSPRSPSSSYSANPYSYRPRRQIYPHKRDYVPRDQYYETTEREERDRYYDDERTKSYHNEYDYGAREELYEHQYYDDDYQDWYNQNGEYDDNNGYEHGMREEDLYDEDEEFQQSEAYYNQQRRINAKAIQKMKAKLIRNQRRIAEEHEKLDKKKRSKYDQYYKSEGSVPCGVKESSSHEAHRLHRNENDKYPHSSKYATTSSYDTDDKWAVQDDKASKYRMSLHKDFPYEVDLIDGSSKPPTLQGYDPDKFDSSYFKFNKYKPEQSQQYLVDKYVSKSSVKTRDTSPPPTYKVELTSQVNTIVTGTKPAYQGTSRNFRSAEETFTNLNTLDRYESEARSAKYSSISDKYKSGTTPIPHFNALEKYRTDSAPTVYTSVSNKNRNELEVESQSYKRGIDKHASDSPTAPYLITSDKYKSKQTAAESDSKYTYTSDKYDSKPEDHKRYLSENKENLDTSNVTFGRGKEYNKYIYVEGKSTEESDLTSYMDLPSRLLAGNSATISSKLGSIDKMISGKSAKQKTDSSTSGSKKYRSPYDKYDITTENNMSVITPVETHHPSETDARAMCPSREGFEATLDIKTSSAYYSEAKDVDKDTKGLSDDKVERMKRETTQGHRHEDAQKRNTSKSKPSSGVLKPTSEARSRESSPIRSYERIARGEYESSDRVHYSSREDPSSYRSKDAMANPKTHNSKKREMDPSDYRHSSLKTDITRSNKHSDHTAIKEGKFPLSNNPAATANMALVDTVATLSKYSKKETQENDPVRQDRYIRTTKEPTTKDTAGSYEYAPNYRGNSPSRRDNSSVPTENKPYISTEDHKKSSDTLLKEMENKYKLTSSSAYRPSEPLHVKDRNYDKLSQQDYRGYNQSSSSTTAVLNSKNLKSLDRENAAKLKLEQAEDRVKSQISSTKGIADDVSSVAGSSDADFVVTGTGDILRRKSKAAKRLDKVRNAELQMKSFETPYEQYEDEFYRQQDRLAEIEDGEKSEETDDEGTAKGSSEYWGEPKRHFGIRSSNEGKYWSEPKHHVDKDDSEKHSSAAKSALLDDGFNSSVVDQKWFRNVKKEDGKMQDRKKTSNEITIAEAKEKLRKSQDFIPKSDLADERSKQFSDKTSSKSSSTVLEDFEKDKKIIRELFDKHMQTGQDFEKSQRRVHWDQPHSRVKIMTPESDQGRFLVPLDPASQNQNTFNSATNISPKTLSERTDFSDIVKEMKEASGLYEVPKLSKPVSNSKLVASDVPIKDEAVDDMYLPRSMEERQQIVENIIDKYTKDYNPDGGPELSKASKQDEGDNSTTASRSYCTERDFSPKSSRIPVPSPSRVSNYSLSATSDTLPDSQLFSISSHMQDRPDKSAIPIRSPSRESKSRNRSFPNDLSSVKEPQVFTFDSNKSQDTDENSCTSSGNVSNRLGSQNDSASAPPTNRWDKDPMRTHIPMRRGSDVEIRYRRDRSHSRESGSSIGTSKELEDVAFKYTEKSQLSIKT